MSQSRELPPLLPWACAIVLLVLGFLPFAVWIPGGHEAEWFTTVRNEWINGSMIALGAAIVAFIVGPRIRLWPAGIGERMGTAAAAHPLRTALLLGAVAFLGYVAIALLVFSGRPLLIDEIIQLMQARMLAAGELARPATAHPEFFSAQHIVEANGRVFGQFPLGGPLMLLPGVLIGAPWVMGPLFAACSVVLFWALARAMEPRPAVALGATLIFAAAPFAAFMAGSHMNHVPALTWLLIAMWCLHRAARRDARVPWAAFACGFAFGMAGAIRPVDAAAFAAPAAVWLLVRAVRRPLLFWDMAAAGVGLAIPAAGILAYNALTTGDPFLFGYELLWGLDHRLGFHASPWGAPHTPLRGIEIVNLMFLRLQTYLFESPIPSLVPVIAALLLTPRLRGLDRYLLWSSALVVVGYFAYWHDGYYLGPRFAYSLLPALALWTARLPALVRERFPRLLGADRFVLLTYATSAIVALVASIPVRTRQYAGGLTAMRFDYVAPAEKQGVRNALILVRESWGSQLMIRMWALGVSRSMSETLYRGIDACLLEGTISRLERAAVTGPPAIEAFIPLLRDSARVVRSKLSPDVSERMLPGMTYDDICQKRIAENWAGYTFLPPLLAMDQGSNVYARELHAKDTALFAMYPSRPVYVLRASSYKVGAPLELYPFSPDSAQRDWALAARMVTASSDERRNRAASGAP